MTIMIRRLTDWEAYDWTDMIAESMSEGYRHVGRLALDYEAGANRFDRAGEALFAAEIDGELAGAGGLSRIERAGLPAIGRVRRVYVMPRFRRFGVGSALMREVVALASLHYEELVLRTDNPAADALYASFGFRKAKDREDATHVLRLEGNKP
ncbi:GNAT family N-acetyltransferase [Paenibacillus sacheonensis]|uniref:GNAT family N-acetyltransferase n=1 Tax=Paenibacillus sacheonensis TaxID=742054 RepID=A0A7X5BZH2_9BACL|nr:GNAT family N-acetyltransferase [Paenibacillus sacheonensis]MBM7568948.1 ribosomal protein S18 acetylase RimI-like enzyme [Paenibacillus sacheonensis]NBC72678.1 GNAT family N-acetyltransferase [Paenibacillus sacheonensis]